MVDLVLEYSKYLMLLILLLYTILNFYVMLHQDPAWQNRICRKQMSLVMMLQFLGYMILYLVKQDLEIIIFYGVQAAVFFLYYNLFGWIYRHGSRILISNLILLAVVGLMIQTRLNITYAYRQFIFMGMGMVMTLIIPVIIRYMHFLAKWAWVYAILGIGLLAVVWRMGNTSFGAQLSITVGGIAIQPSEVIKITFVFFTASMLQKSQEFKQVVITTIVAAIHVLILVISTDLGSALVYFMSYLFMLLVATQRFSYMLAGLGSGSLAAVVGYKLFYHVRVRVAVWKDPFFDYDVKGYQIAQALFGISTGGWLGLGFCRGIPNSIPLGRNDMVFAVICEEFGGIFAVGLILIYLGFILQMCWVSTWMNELFYKISGFGMAVMMGFQVFLHIGGNLKMIPLTGITLPLISYGGSSVLSTMIVIGIIQGLHLMKAKADRDEEAMRIQREEAFREARRQMAEKY